MPASFSHSKVEIKKKKTIARVHATVAVNVNWSTRHFILITPSGFEMTGFRPSPQQFAQPRR
jgi:hypothetical protein